MKGVDPGLRRILAAAATRLERNGLRTVGRVRLDRITADEVRALSGLLGSRWRSVLPGATATVSLGAVDDALRESACGGSLAAAAAAAQAAPLVDRRAARHAEDGRRSKGWVRLAEHPAVAGRPALRTWLDRERMTGAALRSARTAAGDAFALLASVLDLVAELPADPPQTLTRFAATHCGDPHALDRDTALDRVLRRALAQLDGQDVEIRGAEARRRLYDRWGIGCDELSSTVLCAGVRPTEDGLLAVALRASAAAGEPRVVTLRELRAVRRLTAGARVFCCENPDVVAAAVDALGPRCPALVCTGGWPSIACVVLLRALCTGAAQVQHHGDMDPEGLRILDRVLGLTGGQLWRISVADYERAAVPGATSNAATNSSLTHPALAALDGVLRGSGRFVREEQVLSTLIADLTRAAEAEA
ncbi:MAG: hypothetical protein QOK16_831 [Solirubrobacteraceae bacterium]|nr:hypothetical protein [Solirubrobacteraceae bacterium]